MKFIIIVVLAWLLGVFGWSQIIGSIQNIATRKNLWFTLLIWTAVMIAGAYFAITKFDGLIPVLIGYGVSFVIVLGKDKIE